MTPKILIGFLSCGRDRPFHNLVRSTWLQQCPPDVPYKFFLGHGNGNPAADEVILEAPDDYGNLSIKLQEMVRYAEPNCDFLFRADVDTYTSIPRLLRSDYQSYNVLGSYGGAGIWISKRAMGQILAHGNHRSSLAEDWWLREAVKFENKELAKLFTSDTWEGPALDNEIITTHRCSEPIPGPNGTARDRSIRTQERMARFPGYWEKAKFIS